MPPRKKLGEILIQAGALNDAKLRMALTEQKRWGGPLGRILVEMKLISEDAMVQALSQQLNFPVVNLETCAVDGQALDVVSAELAEQHGVIPFALQGKFLDVAMSDPTNLGIIDELRIRTRLNVRPYLAGPKAIERAIAKHYGRGFAQVDFAPTASVSASASASASQPTIGSAASHTTGPVPPIHAPTPVVGVPVVAADRSREIAALQERVQHLEALIARDEDVLRKLLSLFVEKGLATREEILERIK